MIDGEEHLSKVLKDWVHSLNAKVEKPIAHFGGPPSDKFKEWHHMMEEGIRTGIFNQQLTDITDPRIKYFLDRQDYEYPIWKNLSSEEAMNFMLRNLKTNPSVWIGKAKTKQEQLEARPSK